MKTATIELTKADIDYLRDALSLARIHEDSKIEQATRANDAWTFRAVDTAKRNKHYQMLLDGELSRASHRLEHGE